MPFYRSRADCWNFSFEAFAQSSAKACLVLWEGLKAHAQKIHATDPDSWLSEIMESIELEEIELEVVYRDGKKLS